MILPGFDRQPCSLETCGGVQLRHTLPSNFVFVLASDLVELFLQSVALLQLLAAVSQDIPNLNGWSDFMLSELQDRFGEATSTLFIAMLNHGAEQNSTVYHCRLSNRMWTPGYLDLCALFLVSHNGRPSG